MNSEPKIVWHYTSIENLESFISPGASFKGNCANHFLDRQEIIAGDKIFQQAYEEVFKKTVYEPVSKKSYFIGCFTAKEDDERFWKERTKNGGFAIGFKTESLPHFLFPVSYSENDYLNYLIDKLRGLQKIQDLQIRQQELDYYREIAPALYKKENFKWEDEYRLVVVDHNSEVDLKDNPARILFHIIPNVIMKIIVSPFGKERENRNIVRNLAKKILLNECHIHTSKLISC